ncbi:hypothetical protein LOC54_02930 [Acetobacter sp. AN02]|uniref:hypothetical protein n=1 Tax=Acetobacter sp. AN02 TaxID=2894186 RepID=UPI002434451E|nr:hypothetical protein [Acetobacter sp. AN02]MDG6094078.1 hypothetical protein [Acetobacter sp. AN02]
MKMSVNGRMTGRIWLSGLSFLAVASAFPAVAASNRTTPSTPSPEQATGPDPATERLNAAQEGANYRGPVYYPGQKVQPASAAVVAAPVSARQTALPVVKDLPADPATERLNAAQEGTNYRGPVYYPGQQIQPARSAGTIAQ